MRKMRRLMTASEEEEPQGRNPGAPRGFDEAAALVDDIVDVGIGGHYLSRRSTRDGRRRGELWKPSIFRRQTADSYAGTTLKDEAIERAEHLMATHEVAPLPAECSGTSPR